MSLDSCVSEHSKNDVNDPLFVHDPGQRVATFNSSYSENCMFILIPVIAQTFTFLFYNKRASSRFVDNDHALQLQPMKNTGTNLIHITTNQRNS